MIQSSNKKAWFVWGIAAFFYLYELVLRVSPSVMTDHLTQSFSVTATSLGILVSFYYYSYTILQLPCGIILDELGSKKLLGFSSLLCTVGSILFASTNMLQVAQIGRFLVGAGSACAFISCMQIAASMFPKRYFVLLGGATNMMGTLGGLLGGYPVAKAVNSIGWQYTTFVLAAIGCILCVVIFMSFPSEVRSKESDTLKRDKSMIVNDTLQLVKNKQILISSIIASLMYLPICAFAELWEVPYFMQKFNIGNEQASISSAITFLGVAIGSIIMALIANKINSFVKTIRISALFVGILFVALIYLPVNFYTALLLVFVIGFLTGSQAICFTCAKNNAVDSLSGTTLALTNCIVMLIGSIFQPLLGVLLDASWGGLFNSDGSRLYDITCYNKAMLVIPLGSIISYVFSIFLKETINQNNE
ncbi:MAG: MFS transporter [Alphaproteobacteria bacterium]|nr:MFS transporter [Alphaproteobacteria bacterium]